MGCPSETTVEEYLSGGLDEEARAEVRRHLEGCAECRALVAALDGTLAAVAVDGSTVAALARAIGGAVGAAGVAVEPPPPSTVGRYRIERRVGAGAMGVVYAAHDPSLRRTVALKLIRPLPTAGFLDLLAERLLREAQAMARLSHPHVLPVYDAGTVDGQLYVAMELVDGGTLGEWLARAPRSVAEIVGAFAQAGRGLAAAHAAGLVHRDVKPSNVLVGGDGRVRVSDFGLARFEVLRDDGGEGPSSSVPVVAQTVSRTGSSVGTPAYMAPEQMRRGSVDARADQFSFCVALWEALYGERPFAGETLGELAEAIAARRVRAAPSGRRVPARLRAVVLRGLAAAPEGRFPSMEALLEALAAATRPRRRRGVGVVVGAAAAAGLAAAVVFVVKRERPAAPPVVATRALAVVGLKDGGARPGSAWLATALPEMLATELGDGAQLRVTAPDSVARLGLDASEAASLSAPAVARVAEALHVDLVLGGSYVALPSTAGAAPVRVDLRVVDARSGQPVALLSESGSEATLFELAARAGARLREALHVQRAVESGAVKSVLPSNLEAARLYAEGLGALGRSDALGARGSLERAAALDPESPRVHAALARAWGMLGYGARARDEAKRAFELAGPLPADDRLRIEAAYRRQLREWPRAIALLGELAARHPDDLPLTVERATVLSRAGRLDEAQAVLDAARARPGLSDEPALDLAEARLAYERQDAARQKGAATRARDRAQARGERFLVIDAENLLAIALGDLGDVGPAKEAFARAEEGAVAVGDRRRRAEIGVSRGALSYGQGDFAAARAAFEEALVYGREVGDGDRVIAALNNLAGVIADEGDLATARKRYEEALAESRAHDDLIGVAMALHNLGSVLAELGELRAARAALEESLTRARALGEKRSEAQTLNDLARLASQEGHLDESRRVYQQALVLHRELGDQSSAGIALSNLGQVYADLGERAAARASHLEALAIRERLGQTLRAARTRVALATLDAEEHHPDDAARRVREAIPVLAKEKDAGERDARLLLARALLDGGKLDEARAALAEARAAPRTGDTIALMRTDAVELFLAAELGPPAERARSLDRLAALARRAAARRSTAEELEARLAIGELERRLGRTAAARAHLTALAQRARQSGFASVALRADDGLRALATEERRSPAAKTP